MSVEQEPEEDASPNERTPIQRLDFMVGQIAVPDDFDRMGDPAIASLFYLDE